MKLNILVIDDEEGPRTALTYALEHYGHFVVAVESVKAARAGLGQMRFDLVISDQNLRDPSGVQGADLLNALAETHPSVKRLLMSARGDPGGHSAAFLRKPYGLDELTAKIDVLFAAAAH